MGDSVLTLLRHCHPAIDASLCLGQLDVPLSPQGLRAASELDHPCFEHIDLVVSSDLQRAMQTANAVIELTGAELQLDHRWRELHMGVFTGLSWDAIHAQYPQELARWGEQFATQGPPGGESFSQLQQRVRAAFGDLQPALVAGRRVLVISHLGAIRALRHVVHGMGIDEAMQFPLGHGAILEFPTARVT